MEKRVVLRMVPWGTPDIKHTNEWCWRCSELGGFSLGGSTLVAGTSPKGNHWRLELTTFQIFNLLFNELAPLLICIKSFKQSKFDIYNNSLTELTSCETLHPNKTGMGFQSQQTPLCRFTDNLNVVPRCCLFVIYRRQLLWLKRLWREVKRHLPPIISTSSVRC